jgi:uridine kinase
MLAIAGDSAAGKTTLTKGLVDALGVDRITSLCVDDYHRYDRQERKGLPFTALHPDCNYVQIMEQHLQLLATGQPVLKPIYDHHTGQLIRPELIEPTDFVIVEGLLPLHTRLAQACFDITVYLDPPEHIRATGRSRGMSASAGTPRSRCWPNSTSGSPSPRRSSARNAPPPTSWSGSALSRPARTRRTPRCRRS